MNCHNGFIWSPTKRQKKIIFIHTHRTKMYRDMIWNNPWFIPSGVILTHVWYKLDIQVCCSCDMLVDSFSSLLYMWYASWQFWNSFCFIMRQKISLSDNNNNSLTLSFSSNNFTLVMLYQMQSLYYEKLYFLYKHLYDQNPFTRDLWYHFSITAKKIFF